MSTYVTYVPVGYDWQSRLREWEYIQRYIDRSRTIRQMLQKAAMLAFIRRPGFDGIAWLLEHEMYYMPHPFNHIDNFKMYERWHNKRLKHYEERVVTTGTWKITFVPDPL